MKKTRKALAAMLSILVAASPILTSVSANVAEPAQDWQAEHQELARRMESEAILLLKNE